MRWAFLWGFDKYSSALFSGWFGTWHSIGIWCEIKLGFPSSSFWFQLLSLSLSFSFFHLAPAYNPLSLSLSLLLPGSDHWGRLHGRIGHTHRNRTPCWIHHQLCLLSAWSSWNHLGPLYKQAYSDTYWWAHIVNSVQSFIDSYRQFIMGEQTEDACFGIRCYTCFVLV